MSAGNGRSAVPRWAVVVAALAVLLVVIAVPTTRWATGSRSFCAGGCHEPQAAHLGTPGHETVACQSCHAVRAGTGLRLALSRLVGGKGPEHGKATAAACSSCHNPRDARWPRVALTRGHRKHEGAENVDCLSCHAKASHGGGKAAQTCVTCHADARLHDPKKLDEGASPQCLACHNFSAPHDDLPTAHAGLTIEACGTCHGPGAKKAGGVVPGRTVRPDDLHGGVDCKLCHQPHSTLPANRPCRSCHQVQLLSGNPNLPPEHLECTKCHVQHKPVAQAGSQCVHCHEQARAHTDAGVSQTTALRHDECASCHLPHTWKAAPNDCVTCHSDEATSVRTKSPERHQRCINCHEVHGAPPSGATCTKCHQDNARKMLSSAAPTEHKRCIGCHKPHAPVLTVPQGCAECHKSELHQVVSLGPADHVKAGCDGCHTLHGDPKATTRNCVSCHKTQGASVARVTQLPRHQLCTSCHAAHVFSFDPKSPSCSVTCHKEITPTVGPHQGACTKCHAPHASPVVSREKCQGCHEKIRNKPPEKAPEHAKCSSCHKPHTMKETAQKACVTCHDDKPKVAATWPERSPHRDTCHECHQPHDVKAKIDCTRCHEKQAAQAQGGKHECKACHAPHKPPATDRKGWWNRCVGCHEKEVTASQRHNQCPECHKPHAYKPPACTSCHAEEASKGSHLVKGHAECTKCHDAHAATKPTRTQCLACHEDKATHEPKAPVCYGCHTFK